MADSNLKATEDAPWRMQLMACLSGFALACATFFLSALVLLPITLQVGEWLHIPMIITVVLAFVALIGLTVAAGIAGVLIVACRAAGPRDSK